jgi:hypothetical protein
VSDDIVGYMTVRYPLRRECESADYETNQQGWHYVEVAPNGAEVTIDLADPDHIRELAVTDDAGFLFDSSDHEVPVSRAITALIPDFDLYRNQACTADAQRRIDLWRSLRVVHAKTAGPTRTRIEQLILATLAIGPASAGRVADAVLTALAVPTAAVASALDAMLDDQRISRTAQGDLQLTDNTSVRA